MNEKSWIDFQFRSYGAIAASRCCIIEVAFLSASAFVIDSNDPCCGGKEETHEEKI